MKEGDLLFGGARQFDETGVEGIDTAFSEVLQEATQGD